MERAEHNGPGFFYQVKYRKHNPDDPDAEEYTVINITDPETNSITVEPTETYEPYDIQVMAFNDLGEASQPPTEIVGYSGEDSMFSCFCGGKKFQLISLLKYRRA